MKRDAIEAWYPESRFGGFTDIDGTVLFYTRLRALANPDSSVLDVGCGRGRHGEDPIAIRRELRNLRGRVKRVIGIDIDPVGEENPFLDEFRQIPECGRFPVESGSVDIVFADYVLEHLTNPDNFFSECYRVLRPSGVIAIRTTNALGYVAWLARVFPRSLHVPVLTRVQDDRRRPSDMFIPIYACNTRRRLRRALERAGFDPVVYAIESEPRYFRFSRWLYALAALHQRYAPRAFKLALVGFARKGSPDPS